MKYAERQRIRNRIHVCLANALYDATHGAYPSALVQAACAVVHLAHLAEHKKVDAIVARITHR